MSPRRRGRTLSAWLFLAPALLLYSVFVVYPLGTAFSYSFFRWRGTLRDSFAGLANYVELLSGYGFGHDLVNALTHNLVLFAAAMLIQNSVGLAFAVAFVKARRGKRVLQTSYALPYLVNPLVVGYLWTLLLSSTFGPLSQLFRDLGMGWLARGWLGDPRTALGVVIFVSVWQWVGFPMLFYSAALAGIPAEYAEAARVDGASAWQTFRRITLPLLAPAIGTMTVLTFIGSMNTFGLVYAFGGDDGGPAGSTDVLGVMFYRVAFTESPNRLGISSAMAVLMFIYVCGTAIALNHVLRRREARVS